MVAREVQDAEIGRLLCERDKVVMQSKKPHGWRARRHDKGTKHTMENTKITQEKQALSVDDQQGVGLCLTPVFAMFRIEEMVDRLRVFLDQARLDLRQAMHQRKLVTELLSVFSEESSEATRRLALERVKNLSEKEMGPWFWRRPDEGSNLLAALRDRKEHLCDLGYSIDWQWDLLADALLDWTGEADDELLRAVFEVEVDNACSK